MAEIAGEFVGSLSADLLRLRSSGRISGDVNYGKLEVELLRRDNRKALRNSRGIRIVSNLNPLLHNWGACQAQ